MQTILWSIEKVTWKGVATELRIWLHAEIYTHYKYTVYRKYIDLHHMQMHIYIYINISLPGKV